MRQGTLLSFFERIQNLSFSLSLVHSGSFISGITLLGLPTEVYSYGIQYVYVMFGVILMGLVMSYVYLPVFHNLHITSTYEVNGDLCQFRAVLELLHPLFYSRKRASVCNF